MIGRWRVGIAWDAGTLGVEDVGVGSASNVADVAYHYVATVADAGGSTIVLIVAAKRRSNALTIDLSLPGSTDQTARSISIERARVPLAESNTDTSGRAACSDAGDSTGT